MRRLEITTALIFLCLCVVVIVTIWDQPYWSDFAPGSAFLPYWVAGLGAILAVVQLSVSAKRRGDEHASWPDRAGALRVLMTVSALWLFIAIVPWLGTAISATSFMLGLLLLVLRRRWLPSLITTIITVGMIELIFILWLDIRLPRGVFGI